MSDTLLNTTKALTSVSFAFELLSSLKKYDCFEETAEKKQLWAQDAFQLLFHNLTQIYCSQSDLIKTSKPQILLGKKFFMADQYRIFKTTPVPIFGVGILFKVDMKNM